MAAAAEVEYTKSQLNYFRICYVANDILTEGLRTIFKQEWDNRYKATLGEWKDEPRNGLDFWNGESPRNRSRNARLLTTIIKGDRAEWDCTMLFYAILYSDCIHSLNPLVKTNVNVLRKFYIEEFAQRPRGHMSATEFSNAISTVTSAFYGLFLSTLKLEAVIDQELEYSEEELNFFKICYITTDIITDGLRTIFKQEWDSRYKETLGEWKDEPKNGLDFWSGESPRNHKRNGLLLATMCNGDRTEWDLVMLYYAILFSDCFPDLNLTVKSNVDDLRVLRSEVFAHMPRARLSDVEFQTAVKKVFAAFQALALPTLQIQRVQYCTVFRLETDSGPNIENDGSERSMPFYILARGAEAKAAYQRALETGETTDKRVKVLLVGQDRVGKTSVGRSLKGEQFIKDESSTDGVQINRPLKYVGIKPWKNSAEEQETTVFHHKCAPYITEYFSLSLRNSEGSALEMETITETIADKTELSVDGELQGRQDTRKTCISEDVESESHTISSKKDQETKYRNVIPEKVIQVAVENLEKDKSDNDDKVWPVILDFAGQAIYRAIHPIFVSREAVYVLVVDLTKDLSAIARCCVKEAGYDEIEIRTPDSSDTNLDHILRWMDVVHSFKHEENDEILPPVILVGTHADLVQGDPNVEITNVKDIVCDTARDLSGHIIGKTFAVNNTLAGKELHEEDPNIVALRQEILKVGDTMPHTNSEAQRLVQNVILKPEKINIVFVKPVMVKHQ